MNTRRQAFPLPQRGAATLVVVMVLFLVMALLAAYANRSMLFEQRVASGFFRANVAMETAEAAVEWTLAQLNGTAVNDVCLPVATGGKRFADRYLVTDISDRRTTRAFTHANAGVDCARDAANGGWSCRCPADPTAAYSTRPAMSAPAAAFAVTFDGGPRGGTVNLNVLSCTDSTIDICRSDLHKVSQQQLATTLMGVTLGLVSAVRTPPAAPLVVRGDVVSTGTDRLGLHNTDPRSAGMLASLGGSWTGPRHLETVPGASVSQTVKDGDRPLQGSAEAVFKMFMGASTTRYQQHPALRKISCSGDCASAIDTAYKAGRRILWVDGPLNITSNKVIGTVADPVLLIASGDVTLDGPFQLTGMLVTLGNLGWTNAPGAASSRIHGVVLVGGNMTTSGGVDIVYEQAVADHLRNRLGSYVRVPGSWVDNKRS